MPADLNPISPIDLNDASASQKLAGEMVSWVKAFAQKRSVIEPRWDQIDKQLQGQTDVPRELPWDGFVYRNIPMLEAKADQWLAYVCNAPTSTTPYLVGTMFNRDANKAKTVEQDFYMLMRKAEWSRYFKQVTKSMGSYGKGVWRLTLCEGNDGRIGFNYQSVPMRRFFVYPDIPRGIEEAKACGHTFEMRKSQIQMMQDRGELWKGVEVAITTTIKDAPTQVNLLSNSKSIAKTPEDSPVRLAEVFFKHQFSEDTFERWYRAWVTLDSPAILAIWPYPYSRPWYFQQFLDESEDSFLVETSRFGKCMGLQLALNEQWNTYSAAAQAGAFPSAFFLGGALNQKYGKFKPGQYMPVTSAVGVQQVQSKFDAGPLHDIIEGLYRKASEVFRLDEQAQGVRTSSDQTATAAQIRQGGTQVAITDDLASIDICMGQMGCFQQELFKHHYLDFLEDYGDDLSTQPDEQTEEKGYPAILDKPIIWELQGRSPFNTPMAQQQAAMQLFTQLAQITQPETVQVLLALGINVAALVQTTVSNSSIANNSTLLTNPAYTGEDPQQQQQAMAEMFQKIAEMRQPKQEPKQPSESITMPYKDAPPSIQAQIEQLFGFQPDPAHQQGMPSVGSDGHKNLMEMMHGVKDREESTMAQQQTQQAEEQARAQEQQAQLQEQQQAEMQRQQDAQLQQQQFDLDHRDLDIKEKAIKARPAAPKK